MLIVRWKSNRRSRTSVQLCEDEKVESLMSFRRDACDVKCWSLWEEKHQAMQINFTIQPPSFGLRSHALFCLLCLWYWPRSRATLPRSNHSVQSLIPKSVSRDLAIFSHTWEPFRSFNEGLNKSRGCGRQCHERDAKVASNSRKHVRNTKSNRVVSTEGCMRRNQHSELSENRKAIAVFDCIASVKQDLKGASSLFWTRSRIVHWSFRDMLGNEGRWTLSPMPHKEQVTSPTSITCIARSGITLPARGSHCQMLNERLKQMYRTDNISKFVDELTCDFNWASLHTKNSIHVQWISPQINLQNTSFHLR
jgi:hypothetical protein